MKVPISVDFNFSYSPDYPFITEKMDKYVDKTIKKITKKFKKYIIKSVKKWRKKNESTSKF